MSADENIMGDGKNVPKLGEKGIVKKLGGVALSKTFHRNVLEGQFA